MKKKIEEILTEYWCYGDQQCMDRSKALKLIHLTKGGCANDL